METLIKTKKRPEKYTRQKKEIRKPSDPVKREKLLGAEEVHIEGDQLKQIIKGDQKANKNPKQIKKPKVIHVIVKKKCSS